jgi:outer membrane receptor protein involved in Fe transport
LNFALGNFLGASELDLMKVEIVSGASSAFYGPNAFNGVISMHTKNPFLFPGFSANVKLGERGLNEYAVRYAQVFKNKEGENKFAYKLNLFYMNAYDWVANNSNAVAGLDTDENNPGGYDAVNRYGDENLSPTINNSLTGLTGDIDSAGLWKRPGLKRWHRTGYWEEDVVDYDTENFKAALALHYLIKEDVELIASSNFGTGTTVYQGDNRFSLKDILFFQNRLEIKKQDDFFIRAYATHEDAGNSYDAVLTAFLMQDAAASNVQWSSIYSEYWWDNIVDRVRDLDPSINWTPWYDPTTNPPNHPPDYNLMELVYAEYQDSLIAWHNEAANYANTAYAPEGTSDFYEPGTARFDSLLNDITSKTSFLEGGSRIQDKSALYHLHAEKIFKTDFALFTIGMNGRLYRPRSDGSLFSDTNGVVIYNKEAGVYGGLEKKMLDNKLILKTTLRLDKNQNFQLLPSPALSLIYQPNENHTIRTTFTSAIRNPTLLNQYMYYNVGRALLVGNISGYDSLATPESFLNYLTSGNNESLLDYYNLDPIKPEKVKCIELGYRATLFNKVYVDASYYFNWYRDFIGYKNGIDFWIDTVLYRPRGIQAYRIATNSNEQITTQGFSIGVNYYIGKYFAFNSNYSWNKLNKLSDDPIIPAYNTPEHKFNIGFSGRDVIIDAFNIKGLGFNINYKWIEGFIFEGSPQFTGYVPTYSLLDIQVNKKIPRFNLTAKAGASNVLNNKVLQVYGGPYVGRMIYFSLLFDWENK